jgi:hypothetical protein
MPSPHRLFKNSSSELFLPGGRILEANPLGVEVAPEGEIEDGGLALGLGAEEAGGGGGG